jgi:HlyD family type I secretion membrane fusion protein
MKSAKEAIQSAKNVVAFPKPPARRQRDEIAFLPAALEIVETPPSPIGRPMGATLIVVFCLGLIWACFGHVDIVATATGKVVPNGRVKLIQPFETGVVRAIEIRDGQSVKAGDVLIELDPTMSTAEEEHIKNDLMAARLDVARLRAGLSDADDPQAEFNPPAGASPTQVKMQQAYLAKQVEEHRAKIATLDRQQAQKQAERDTAAAAIQKLEASSPIIKERVDIRKYLVDKELGSRLTYLETLQQLTENQKDLVVQKSRLQETDAALAGIISTRQQTEAEFWRTLFSELNEAERKAGGLADDLSKAERRTKLQLLTAPVDGVVQQLAVHTVGGVVTPARSWRSSCPPMPRSKSRPWSRTATSASITRIACPATSAASGCTAPPVTFWASIRAKNRRALPLPTSAGRSPILMSVSPCRARCKVLEQSHLLGRDRALPQGVRLSRNLHRPEIDPRQGPGLDPDAARRRRSDRRPAADRAGALAQTRRILHRPLQRAIMACLVDAHARGDDQRRHSSDQRIHYALPRNQLSCVQQLLE